VTNDQQTITDYAHAFERHLAGSATDRARSKAALVEHLSDAADAGELAAALQRLGSPEAAAAAFAGERSAPQAPVGARLVAALIDNLPLLGVAIALFVQDLGRGGNIVGAFPPFVYARFGGACVALAPVPCGAYEGGLLYAVGVPLALAWSILGVGLLDSRTSAAPGKRLLGLRVVTQSGLRVHPVAGTIRRLSLLLGPIAWLDWAPALWGERRRILDHVAQTKVVIAAPGAHPPRPDPAGRPLSS
jgi:uncharacterized RDD family membrane protein YckC